MAKIKEAQITYKCGHCWTEQYARSASLREVKAAQDRAKYKACPNCEIAESKEG